MRAYQLDGFHFLAYLATNRFGGVLADDMGLGKTLQTLTWLVWLREQTKNPGPALVVCPKSVMDNWHAEAERFARDLRVKVWPASQLNEFSTSINSADLHVLNYTQLRILGETLSSVRWPAAILDEGQYIKNPSSQTAQVARSLDAEHRLVLTGTPIENRLLDLWSLMAFAMPGVLGSRNQFAKLTMPKTTLSPALGWPRGCARFYFAAPKPKSQKICPIVSKKTSSAKSKANKRPSIAPNSSARNKCCCNQDPEAA